MSTQDEQTDIPVNNTVNDQQNENVDYADPESPTLAIRRLASPTTGQTKRQNDDGDRVDTDKQQLDMIPEDEVLKLTWDGSMLNGPEASVYCPSHPIKRRRLDLGELMVKTTSSTKPNSDKPIEQFRSVPRPEITRLTENDPVPPPTAKKLLGRGSGKAGRPLVSDLAQARANEALLKQQLMEERQKHDAFRQEEARRTARLIEQKEQEYLLQVQQIRGLSTSENDSNPPQGILNVPEPVMTFYDARSSDSSIANGNK
jgi:hypothetical protein